ncbi:hypothetical protein [Streptomyces atratus]|uniref:Uncharacterized protein n=1 Tax=Streptomyces atratus TaxID=1893 RepID=A0A1K2FD25_STRAR|nr:hypothetical protein [Streptomyces atratus]SFY45100.1 hypothetical protein SAMN02787144_10608 [Streptomyces atratus]
MNTRRTLGTGPTTSTRSTTSPRLLPVERADPDALLAGRADPEQTALQDGRRVLGTGPKSRATDS